MQADWSVWRHVGRAKQWTEVLSGAEEVQAREAFSREIAATREGVRSVVELRRGADIIDRSPARP